MANINIKFNNKDYLLSCEDGQEENLKELADYLDTKYFKGIDIKYFEELPRTGES